MRGPFYPSDDDYIKAFRHRQQVGGGIPVYGGVRRQRGAGILGSAFKFLSKYALPIFRKIIYPAASRVFKKTRADVSQQIPIGGDSRAAWRAGLKKNLRAELLGGAG